MNAERTNTIALLLVFLSAFIFQPSAFSDLLAFDNADNDPYPLGWNPGDNGGVGFAGWVVLESGTPGSMYVDNLTELEGNYSWGESGTFALGRGLSNSLADGYWTFLARHDSDNSGFSGFNLRSSTNIGAGFDSSELLRFGMDPGIAGYDNTGVYISTNGGVDYAFLGLGGLDIRNATLQYSVEWHSAGTYSLTVSNVTAGGFATFGGNMSAGSNVAMLGMGIFGANSGETLTFDAFSVAVPEPSTFAAAILGGLLLFVGRRRSA
jgi:hypothetical protein